MIGDAYESFGERAVADRSVGLLHGSPIGATELRGQRVAQFLSRKPRGASEFWEAA